MFLYTEQFKTGLRFAPWTNVFSIANAIVVAVKTIRDILLLKTRTNCSGKMVATG